MKKLKTWFAFVLCVTALVCSCVALASCSTPVEPPAPVVKVQSVTLQYNQTNVNGVLETDLSLGTMQLNAVVLKDEGATVTVVYDSSDKTVAEISQSGLVTLKSVGETVISVTAGDKKHEIVLIVEDITSSEGYTVTVNGGTADKTKAKAGTTVLLTPTIPEDKEFSGWTMDDNIIKVNGNTFEMPETNVIISANFVNKLLEITLVNEPDNNQIVKGGALNTDGLKIMAKAALSGEEWDVTKECTFSSYEGGDTITASYTLGEVTKNVEIEVEDITSSLAEDIEINIASVGLLSSVPTDLNSELSTYQDTGAILLTSSSGSQIGIYQQGSQQAVSSALPGDKVAYYFYSEVAGTANVTLTAASAAFYSTEGEITPNGVREINFNDRYNITVNGTLTPALDTAVIEAYSQDAPSWTVCYRFMDVSLLTMEVKKGWNVIEFEAVTEFEGSTNTRVANLADLEISFQYDA